jgi:hypothetical protein
VVGRLVAAVAKHARWEATVPTLLDLSVDAVVAHLHTSAESTNVPTIRALPSELQQRIDSAARGNYTPPPSLHPSFADWLMLCFS